MTVVDEELDRLAQLLASEDRGDERRGEDAIVRMTGDSAKVLLREAARRLGERGQ